MRGAVVLLACLAAGCARYSFDEDRVHKWAFQSVHNATQQRTMPGKVVAISKMMPSTGGGIKEMVDDDVMKALPPELRANKTDEVGTVVWVEWQRIIVGQYVHRGQTSGTAAHRWRAAVSVIDPANGERLGYKEFIGPEPPKESRQVDDDSLGVKPIADIVDFIGKWAKH